jgi:hypothetical protein
MRVTRAVVTAGLIALVAVGPLGACASSGSGASAGGAGAGSTSPAGVIPTTAPSPTPSVTLSPPAVGVTVTVSGTVAQGAEPSCLILTTNRGQFELLSGTAGVHAGDHVVATGHVAKVMTHCMQGQPFQVDRLTIG